MHQAEQLTRRSPIFDPLWAEAPTGNVESVTDPPTIAMNEDRSISVARQWMTDVTSVRPVTKANDLESSGNDNSDGGTNVKRRGDGLVGLVAKVEWLDPRSNDSWRDKSEATYTPPARCTTWGRVLRDDDECLVVTTSEVAADQWGGAYVGGTMSIPAALVTKVTVIKG